MTGHGTPGIHGLPASTNDPATPQVEAGSFVERRGDSGNQPVPVQESRAVEAPRGDVATIRVESRRDRTGAMYFLGWAYINGRAIGEVRAPSREAALAGARESVALKWRNEATGIVPGRGEKAPDKPQDSGSGR